MIRKRLTVVSRFKKSLEPSFLEPSGSKKKILSDWKKTRRTSSLVSGFEKSCYLKPSGSEISNRKRIEEKKRRRRKRRRYYQEFSLVPTAAKRIANVGVRVKPSEARYRGSNSLRFRRCSKYVSLRTLVDERERRRSGAKRSRDDLLTAKNEIVTHNRRVDFFFFLKGIILKRNYVIDRDHRHACVYVCVCVSRFIVHV